MRIYLANSLWQRAGGLLIRPKLLAEEVLWLRPCRSVHTFGMRYAISVFFLDQHNTVVNYRLDVPPNCIVSCMRARSVCEMLPVSKADYAGVVASLERELSLNTVV